MSPAKKSAPKNTKPVAKIEETEEVVPPAKIKKGFDAEGHEIHDAVPEKIEEEDAFAVETAESDESGEDGGLDEEEIDPFKDKWEE